MAGPSIETVRRACLKSYMRSHARRGRRDERRRRLALILLPALATAALIILFALRAV